MQHRLSTTRERRIGGFTLVELLVALTVIAVLVALMLPAIARVRSTTFRVICSSNVRQIGLGVAMYTDDNDGVLPQTIFLDASDGGDDVLLETTTLRVGVASRFYGLVDSTSRSSVGTLPTGVWDGLGLLHSQEYLDSRGIFYCPSHSGMNRLRDDGDGDAWADASRDVMGNYQYRAEGPDGTNRLWQIEPRESVLVSDSLRPEDELNHEDGANTLRADLAVLWFSDPEQELLALSRAGHSPKAWRLLDRHAGGAD
ncbi:MAG: prepilin-type N-terminal cleavage/methylation domain-containing protein [Planctomycetota bacterium]